MEKFNVGTKMKFKKAFKYRMYEDAIYEIYSIREHPSDSKLYFWNCENQFDDQGTIYESDLREMIENQKAEIIK